MAELESINSVQRNQLDSSQEHELQSVREVQRSLDRAEYEIQRLKGRLTETENQKEADSARILRLENALSETTAQVLSREALLKEEQRKSEALANSVSENTQRSDKEISRLKSLFDDEKEKRKEMSAQYQSQIKELEEESTERISIIKKSLKKSFLEEYEEKLDAAVRKVKAQYDEQVEKIRQDYLEYEAQQAEREALKRINAAEEKAELISLRAEVQRLKNVHEIAAEQAFKSQYAMVAIGAPPQNSSENTNLQPQIIPKPSEPSKLEEEVMVVLQEQLKAMREQLNRTSFVASSNENFFQPHQSSASRLDSTGGYNFTENKPKSTASAMDPQIGAYFEYRTYSSQEKLDQAAFEVSPRTLGQSNSGIFSSNRTIKRVKFDDDEGLDFSAISDGGYHKGYWRMKYQ